jgi:DNA-binding transcriptional regulator YiaG
MVASDTNHSTSFPHPTVEQLRAEMALVVPTKVPDDPALRKALRVRAGLGLATVARALQVSPLTVARWEAEGRKPWSDHAAKYGRLLTVCRAISAPYDTAVRSLEPTVGT